MLLKNRSFIFHIACVCISILFAIPTLDGIIYSKNTNPGSPDKILRMVSRDFNHPEIEVEPNAIEDELNTGESVEHVLTFTNLGDEAISFFIRHEYLNQPDRDNSTRRTHSTLRRNPRRDDPGEVLFQLEVDVTRIAGFDWDPDERVMWVASCSPRTVTAYSYDGEGGVENIFFQGVEQAVMGIGFLDGIIYTNQYPTSIVHRFDQEGEAQGELEVDCERILDFGTSKSEKWLFALNGINRSIHVYDVENEFQEVGVIEGEQLIDQMEDGSARSICWVDDHPDGQLWIGSEDLIWQFSVDCENWEAELVQEIETPGDRAWLALGHDGENIWRAVSVIDQLVNIYDDGIDELRWITYETEEGNLDAGEDIEIVVRLDATGLLEGEYEGNIHFVSDDPDNPDLEVNIRMNVIGIPVLEVEWNEEAGFPDIINWNNLYLDIFSNENYPIPVEITNAGDDVLMLLPFQNEREILVLSSCFLDVKFLADKV